MTEPIHPLEFDSFPELYYVITRLGVGSFGSAFLTKYRRDMSTLLAADQSKRGTLMEPLSEKVPMKSFSDGLMAVKIMKNRLKAPADYLAVNEVKFILAVPAHPNLLQIFNLFIDTCSGKLHISMEPMNQNLYQFLQKNERRPLTDAVVKSLLAQLLGAIRHIHSHGYFHRDVKPENILVTSAKAYYGPGVPLEVIQRDSFVLKLCDYGLARHVNNPKDLTQYVSTRWYRAPEILLRLKRYSFAIDIWAFASVAVEISTYRPLFAGLNETDQLWQILKELGHPSLVDRDDEDLGGEWHEGVALAENLGFLFPCVQPNSIFNIIDSSKKQLALIVRKCLMWDPQKRPTATQLSAMSYFKDTPVHFEIVGPHFSQLVGGNFGDMVETPFISSCGSPLSKGSMSPIGSPRRVPITDSPTLDVYSDPTYLYTKWSKSSSYPEVGSGGNYSLEPLTVNISMPAINEKTEVSTHEPIQDLAMDKFDSRADTSMASHGILC